MANLYVSNAASNGYVVGSDANDGLTKATAKLTLSGAQTAASDGDVITVNDGTFVMSGALTITKSLTINAQNDYLTTIQVSGTPTAMFVASHATGGTIIFGKIIIDCGNTCLAAIQIANQGTLFTVTLSGTKITNPTRYYVNAITAANVAFTATSAICSSNGTQSMLGGFIFDALATGSFTMTSCTITHSSANGNSIVRLTATTGVTASITSNTINGTFVGTGTGLNVLNIAKAILTNNTITLTSSGACDGIVVAPGSASPVDCSDCLISTNVINHNGTSGHGIIIGTDGSGGSRNGNCNRPTIRFNTVTGSSAATLLHGILFGANADGRIYGNIVDYAGIGIICKLTTGTTFVSGNIVTRSYTNGTAGQYYRSKGAVGVIWINNVAIQSSGFLGNAFYIDSDPTIPTLSTGNIVYNNIVYITSGQPPTAGYVGVAASNTATFAGNDYFVSSGGTAPTTPWSYQGPTYANLAAWIAAKETTALSVDPLFQDTTTYKLLATSTLYNAGTYYSHLAKDYRGRPFHPKPTIGAYEFTSRDSVPVARTVASSRNSS